MYYHLLRAQSKAIVILQSAHIDTEKMYIDAKELIEWVEVAKEDNEEE